MPYMLVRLEVAYGRVDEFSEIMSHLVPILEKKGWRLHGAFVNRIGRLNRCYDLWEMPDANAVSSVLELAGLHNVDRSHISRTLPLAFLAPDIVTAIIAGRTAPDLTLSRIKRLKLPASWQDQRQLLGIR